MEWEIRSRLHHSTLHVPCTLFTVVGEKEEQNKTVNVRTRDNVVHGEMSVEAVVGIFQKLASSFANDDKAQFGK